MMLNRIAIALGLLVGSFVAAWAASSTLSNLNAGGPISGGDLFYDVQAVGVGGVKVTGTQFLNFVFSNVSGSCTASGSGVFTCSAGSSTSIAAGTNISTSGTASNVTVNVVNNPTFTSLTSTVAAFPGFLTASGANLNTATIVSLGGSTQCVESIAGVLTGTGSTCGTGQFSIAAGTNIMTTGTANNIVVSLLTSPTITGTLNVAGTFQFNTETMTFPATTATLAALNIVDQTVTGGANVSSQSLATGNVTIDCGSRPLQFITNGGAYTITAPASDGSCLLLVTNSSSASATTFSGFSVGSNTGDSLDTTNTHKFTINIWRINGTSGYRIAAHQ